MAVGRPQVHGKIFELFCPKGLSFCLIIKTDNDSFLLEGGYIICDRM
jgi:hypothetical protein